MDFTYFKMEAFLGFMDNFRKYMNLRKKSIDDPIFNMFKSRYEYDVDIWYGDYDIEYYKRYIIFCGYSDVDKNGDIINIPLLSAYDT